MISLPEKCCAGISVTHLESLICFGIVSPDGKVMALYNSAITTFPINGISSSLFRRDGFGIDDGDMSDGCESPSRRVVECVPLHNSEKGYLLGLEQSDCG